MTGYCGTCGSVLNGEQKFCAKCGTESGLASVKSPVSPPSPAPSTPAKSGALLKFGIGAVAVILVAGLASLAAVAYVVHKVSQKAHTVVRNVLDHDKSSLGGGPATSTRERQNSNDTADEGFRGDPCRFLTKEEVSRAVGVQIIRTESAEAGCSYVARGNPADMTAKHMKSMVAGQSAALGDKPVDPRTQKLMQSIVSGFFSLQESSDKDLHAQSAKGEVTVLSIWINSGHADLEMKANRMAFNRLSQGGGRDLTRGQNTDRIGTGTLSGIGDDAYEMGGSGLMVRKGNTTARFLFPQCPCNTEAIKPLATKLASQL